MNEPDPATAEYLAHDRFCYPFLVRLEFRVEVEEGHNRWMLTLELAAFDPRHRLILDFEDLRDFRFKPWTINLPLGLRIVSIADRQWQDASYAVSSDEQDLTLSFAAPSPRVPSWLR